MSVELDKSIVINDVQDSPLRKFTAKPLRLLAKNIHKELPILSPNEVSILGLALVLAGGYVAEREKRRPEANKAIVSVAVALQAIGFAMDALDGPLARASAEDGKKHHSKILGALVDIIADREEEIFSAVMRKKTAKLRGSPLGEFAAGAVAMTSTLPNLASQARMALTGRSVPEVGTNSFTIPGTRPGRVATILTENLFPIFGEGFSNRAQTALDLTGAAANVYAVFDRLTAKGFPIDKKTRNIAARKTAVNLGIEAGAIGITVYNGIRKHKRTKIK